MEERFPPGQEMKEDRGMEEINGTHTCELKRREITQRQSTRGQQRRQKAKGGDKMEVSFSFGQL